MDTEDFRSKQLPDQGKVPEEYMLDREFVDFLHGCIHKLKPKYQDVLIYRLYLDMQFSQIAGLMNISENSAKVIYHRGKEMLKKEMEARNYGR